MITCIQYRPCSRDRNGLAQHAFDVRQWRSLMKVQCFLPGCIRAFMFGENKLLIKFEYNTTFLKKLFKTLNSSQMHAMNLKSY